MKIGTKILLSLFQISVCTFLLIDSIIMYNPFLISLVGILTGLSISMFMDFLTQWKKLKDALQKDGE